MTSVLHTAAWTHTTQLARMQPTPVRRIDRGHGLMPDGWAVCASTPLASRPRSQLGVQRPRRRHQAAPPRSGRWTRRASPLASGRGVLAPIPKVPRPQSRRRPRRPRPPHHSRHSSHSRPPRPHRQPHPPHPPRPPRHRPGVARAPRSRASPGGAPNSGGAPWSPRPPPASRGRCGRTWDRGCGTSL